MSSFVQASPVIYCSQSFAQKYQAPTGAAASPAANCYYAARCQTAFYGADGVDSGRCYTPGGGDYDAVPYGYGGPRYEQQQQQHRMFVPEYRPASVYHGYDQPPSSEAPLIYAAGNGPGAGSCSPSAGVVPVASSPPGSAAQLPGTRYSPPSSAPPPPPVPTHQRVGSNPPQPQPPVIYPWMKMVHSVAGKLRRIFTCELLLPPSHVAKRNILTMTRDTLRPSVQKPMGINREYL